MQPSRLIFLSALAVIAMTRRVDPDSQEEFWETIKDNKTVIAVTLNEENAVNSPDETGRWLKFVVISDTHDQLGEMMEKISIPDGDVLIHCGDMTNRGEKEKLQALNEQFD
ncbi:unnamed protein product, partial [Mesorhabditis belari]|uniref:Calcineurin-like phosphoesterase domain-containing protein n=1 Tax=Mesorhabditis belari TaxID=2138241 RepID=A0AAF3FQH5_9BILA